MISTSQLLSFHVITVFTFIYNIRSPPQLSSDTNRFTLQRENYLILSRNIIAG